MAAAAAGSGSGASKVKGLTVEIPPPDAKAAAAPNAAEDAQHRVTLIQHTFSEVAETVSPYERVEGKSERLSAKWISAAYEFLFALSGSSAGADQLAKKLRLVIEGVTAAYHAGDMPALTHAIEQAELYQSAIFLSAAEQPATAFVVPRVIRNRRRTTADVAADFPGLVRRLSDTTRDTPVTPTMVLHRLHRDFSAALGAWRNRSSSSTTAGTPPPTLSPVTVKPVDAYSDADAAAAKKPPKPLFTPTSVCAIGMSNLAYNTLAYLRRVLYREEHRTAAIKPGSDPLLGFSKDRVSAETVCRMRLLTHLAVMALPGAGYRWQTSPDICAYWITQCLAKVGQCSRFWSEDADWQRFVNAQYAEAPEAWGEYLSWLLTLKPREAGYALASFSTEPTRATWQAAIAAAYTLATNYADQSAVERDVLLSLTQQFYAAARVATKVEPHPEEWFNDAKVKMCRPEPVVTVVHEFRTKWYTPPTHDDPAEEVELFAHAIALLTATLNTIAQRKSDRTKETFRAYYLQYRKGVKLADASPLPNVLSSVA